MIRLGQLLKLAGVVGGGGEVKALLAEGIVTRERRAGGPARPSAAPRRLGRRSTTLVLTVVGES